MRCGIVQCHTTATHFPPHQQTSAHNIHIDWVRIAPASTRRVCTRALESESTPKARVAIACRQQAHKLSAVACSHANIVDWISCGGSWQNFIAALNRKWRHATVLHTQHVITVLVHVLGTGRRARAENARL